MIFSTKRMIMSTMRKGCHSGPLIFSNIKTLLLKQIKTLALPISSKERQALSYFSAEESLSSNGFVLGCFCTESSLYRVSERCLVYKGPLHSKRSLLTVIELGGPPSSGSTSGCGSWKWALDICSYKNNGKSHPRFEFFWVDKIFGKFQESSKMKDIYMHSSLL